MPDNNDGAQPVLFSGDVLFRDGIGRTDLPGGSMAEMTASLRDKVLTLPDETVVLPGHGPETTIGRERVHNPFLRGVLGEAPARGF
jgi:hydroxyacylglutathione hydrolase